MTDGNNRSIAQRHNDLVWPIVVLGITFMAAVVIVIVTGHNTNDLIRAIAALGSTSATALAALGYLRAGQAAKQTNGDLDDRMKQSVKAGITDAVNELRSQASAPPAAAPPVVPGRRRKSAAADAPTEKLRPPA